MSLCSPRGELRIEDPLRRKGVVGHKHRPVRLGGNGVHWTRGHAVPGEHPLDAKLVVLDLHQSGASAGPSPYLRAG
jgi:hypothetical protein